MHIIKKSTTIDKQVEILIKRGMIIDDVNKVKEYLLDIGYFRLGFYWFPFEKTYPRHENRDHCFKEGTTIDYAVNLYYFDFDLRNIFLRYISRIEINFRTKLIYFASNEYSDDPFWFANKNNYKKGALEDNIFLNALDDGNKEILIKQDKIHHNNREYAPAWKSLEYMSFGAIIFIYENLNNNNLQCKIAQQYGISSPSQFIGYLHTVRRLRNSCAHGKVLFDQNLPEAIGNGPLGYLGNRKTSLSGAYMVFKYLLGRVSVNRMEEMRVKMNEAFDRIKYPIVKNVILNNSGFDNELL